MNNAKEELDKALKKVSDTSQQVASYICNLLMTRDKMEHLKSIGVEVPKRLHDYENHLEVTIKAFLNLK